MGGAINDGTLRVESKIYVGLQSINPSGARIGQRYYARRADSVRLGARRAPPRQTYWPASARHREAAALSGCKPVIWRCQNDRLFVVFD